MPNVTKIFYLDGLKHREHDLHFLLLFSDEKKQVLRIHMILKKKVQEKESRCF
jgi:hypothetical protein